MSNDFNVYNFNEILEDDRVLYISFYALLHDMPLIEKRIRFKNTMEKCFPVEELPNYIFAKSNEMQKALFEASSGKKSSGTFIVLRSKEEAKKVVQVYNEAGLFSYAVSGHNKYSSKAHALFHDIEKNAFFGKYTLREESLEFSEDDLTGLLYFHRYPKDNDLDGVTNDVYRLSVNALEFLFTVMISSWLSLRKNNSSAISGAVTPPFEAADEAEDLRMRSASLPAGSALASIDGSKNDISAGNDDAIVLKKLVKGMPCSETITWLLHNTSLRSRTEACLILNKFLVAGYVRIESKEGDKHIGSSVHALDSNKFKIKWTSKSKIVLEQHSISLGSSLASLDSLNNNKSPTSPTASTEEAGLRSLMPGKFGNTSWRQLRGMNKQKNVLQSAEFDDATKETGGVSELKTPSNSEVNGRIRKRSQSDTESGPVSLEKYSHDDPDNSLAMKLSVVRTASKQSMNEDPQELPSISDLNQKKGSPASRLKTILDSTLLLKYFTTYMKRQFREENLLFWVDIEVFKTKFAYTGDGLSDVDMELRNKEAERIYNTFLAKGSPRELNLESKLLKDYTKLFELDNAERNKKITSSIFDVLQNVVFEMMALESTADFLLSEEFIKATEEEEEQEKIGKSQGRKKSSWFYWLPDKEKKQTVPATKPFLPYDAPPVPEPEADAAADDQPKGIFGRRGSKTPSQTDTKLFSLSNTKSNMGK